MNPLSPGEAFCGYDAGDMIGYMLVGFLRGEEYCSISTSDFPWSCESEELRRSERAVSDIKKPRARADPCPRLYRQLVLAGDFGNLSLTVGEHFATDGNAVLENTVHAAAHNIEVFGGNDFCVEVSAYVGDSGG